MAESRPLGTGAKEGGNFMARAPSLIRMAKVGREIGMGK